MITLDRLRPVRSLPSRAMWRLNTELSRLGERHQQDWLIYNPIQMYAYHRLARRAAGPAIAAIDDVFPDAQVLLDVGAGTGATAAQAARIGKRVKACEKSPAGRLLARMQGVRSVPFDLRSDRPARVDSPADLAYCFEVAEHLPNDLGDRLVAFVAGLAPIIVFSAAQPGQGGLAHINEQPLAYWRDRFRESGCEFDPALTEQYRASVKDHGADEIWLLSNVSVFTRSNSSGLGRI